LAKHHVATLIISSLHHLRFLGTSRRVNDEQSSECAPESWDSKASHCRQGLKHEALWISHSISQWSNQIDLIRQKTKSRPERFCAALRLGILIWIRTTCWIYLTRRNSSLFIDTLWQSPSIIRVWI
jgi:hypothetical protein